jgi:hypothetical protein
MLSCQEYGQVTFDSLEAHNGRDWESQLGVTWSHSVRGSYALLPGVRHPPARGRFPVELVGVDGVGADGCKHLVAGGLPQGIECCKNVAYQSGQYTKSWAMLPTSMYRQ